ncbi:MAG: WD40/YVTN/BNR-like repeat-containing protein [Candidatus Poribacteria bacterium]
MGRKKGYLSILIFACMIVLLISISVQSAEWKLLSEAPRGVPIGAINQIIIHPTKPNIMYIGTEGIGFLASEDGGKTWLPKNQGFTAAEEGTVSGFQIRCIAIDPSKPDTIYAGMAAFGVFKTTNAGAKWDNISDTLEDTFTKVLAIHPAKTDTVFLGTDGGGIYRYDVAQNEWAEKVKGLKNTYIRALVMDPKDPKVLYAGTDGGVAKTINGAETWTVISNGLTSRYVLCLAIDPKNPKVLYAGTDGGGLFKTIDGGEKWEPVGGGIWLAKPPAEDLVSPSGDVESTLVVSSVVVNPITTSIVYAANQTGVFRSADGGKTWEKINTGLTSTLIKCLAISGDKTVTLYAGTSDGKLFAYTEE